MHTHLRVVRAGLVGLILVASTAIQAADNVALYQPTTRVFRLKNTLSGGTADELFRVDVSGGLVGQAFPVGGNFERDELHGVGLFDRGSKTFHLRHAHQTGVADLSVLFDPRPATGGADMFPIVGDWDGDGVETIGLFHQPSGTFYLRNSNTPGVADLTLTITGAIGSPWLPVAGDWNSNGQDSVGAFNATTKQFLLRDANTSGAATYNFTFQSLPAGAYYPIAGDWDSNGSTTVAAYNQTTSTFHLKNSLITGPQDSSFAFGTASGYLPVAGNWDGDSFRYTVPAGPNGEAIIAYAQLVKTPTQTPGQFELYFPASDSAADLSQNKLMFNVWNGSAWQYPQSRVLLNHQTPDASTAFGSIFIDANPVFVNPQGGTFKRLMYYVYQPDGSPFAGWVCLSFSNDGLTWTSPIKATTNAASPIASCVNDGGIATEAISAFRRGSTIWMAVMEGDTSALITGINAGTTRTYSFLYTLDITNPRVMALQGEFSNLGIERPNKGGRYVHGYGINLDFTYDPTELALYFSRAYPYSYDSTGGIPCNNPPVGSTPRCITGYAQLPNRVQIYKMSIPTGRIRDALSGTWTLVQDYGTAVGYKDMDTGTCLNGVLSSMSQISVGLDINSVSFYKDASGLITRSTLNGRTVVFGAGPKERAYGNCDFTVTGLYVLPVSF